MSYKSQEILILGSSTVIGVVRVFHFFLCCVVLCFVCLCRVSCVASVSGLSILDCPLGFL